MSATRLLERLTRVFPCGDKRWRAVCPAHDSKNNSQALSVREQPDGAVLVKCFAGCEFGDIIAAVGLNASDLFPPRSSAGGPVRGAHTHMLYEAMKGLEHELLLVAFTADAIVQNRMWTQEHAARCAIAGAKIRSVIDAVRR